MNDKYLVLLLKESLTTDSQDIPCQWATGQIGALPVFDDWQAAYNFAGDPNLIITIRATSNGH